MGAPPSTTAVPAFTEADIALRWRSSGKLLPVGEIRYRPGRFVLDRRSLTEQAGRVMIRKGSCPAKRGGSTTTISSASACNSSIDLLWKSGSAPYTRPEAQAYVDTGPPVDREVAEKAGYGWFGKNACLYVPDYGSWVFLGKFSRTSTSRPDPRVTLDCGDCDRCIRACPTGAIIEPFYVDPNRCISHLTQMSGSIPLELREKIGLHVWGCDVCQQVCPWNDGATVANRPEFRPVPELEPAPSLIDMLQMSTGEFRRKFGRTAAAWRGRKTLQRNAAIALGNTRNPKVVPALAQALAEDAKPVVRGSAAWALGRIGGNEAPGGFGARPRNGERRGCARRN